MLLPAAHEDEINNQRDRSGQEASLLQKNAAPSPGLGVSICHGVGPEDTDG